MSRTVDSHDNWVNNPDGLVTTAREPGVHVAQIRNVGYIGLPHRGHPLSTCMPKLWQTNTCKSRKTTMPT